MRDTLSTLLKATACFALTLQGAAAQTAAAPATPPPGAPGAPAPAADATAQGTIMLPVGTGRVIHLRDNASNVFTADPKVAEVRPASANSLFVFGVAPGSTTVAALSSAGGAIGQYQIVVVPSSYDAAMAGKAIGRNALPGIRTEGVENGLSLSGTARTPAEAERALAEAHGILPPEAKVFNRMSVAQPVQVSLHVRVAEMTRTMVRELGVNWTSLVGLGKDAALGTIGFNSVTTLVDTALTPSVFGGGISGTHALQKVGYNLNAAIDALAQDQLVHVLAEPNLTALSGESASFLVGGEFPIPIATNQNTISLEFKQYGISLSFVPTVLANNSISVHVRPEVSALDKANGVTSYLGGGNSGTVAISIPALTVRRADTTVMLGSGQSFAIAGLLSDQTTTTGNGTPGLSDVPILGALFRSDGFQRQQTELVIIVTPYIVKPISNPDALHLPTDQWRAPSDIERILFLRQIGRGPEQSHRRIPADAGFMVE